eukprot:CFRG3129T1
MFSLAFSLVALLPVLADAKLQTYTGYTAPFHLKQGQICNKLINMSVPTGPIAVHGFRADVVEKNELGEFVSVPLYDAYLHHEIAGPSGSEDKQYLYSPMKPSSILRAIGFGAGAESRGTAQKFEEPFAFVTAKDDASWLVNVHIINTRGLTKDRAQKCLECPCTKENRFSSYNDESSLFDSFGQCNAELVHRKNPSCFADTYHNGLKCCDDGKFCFNKDLDPDSNATYYLRYVLTYGAVTKHVRPLGLAACCDVTGNLTNSGNIEYDVPACDKSVDPGCVHVLSTVQNLYLNTSSVYTILEQQPVNLVSDAEVEVVYIVGHQHIGGLGISIYDADTDDLLCLSSPTYGRSNSTGDEKGYLVAMSTCHFDPPLRRKTNSKLRLVAMYDSSVAHNGVMSLVYVAISTPTDATRD